jgi:hypothetical protein
MVKLSNTLRTKHNLRSGLLLRPDAPIRELESEDIEVIIGERRNYYAIQVMEDMCQDDVKSQKRARDEV